MNEANPPSKHHYIPAFYLKRWRATDAKITEFSKPHRKIVVKRVTPKYSGFEHNLYKLQGFEKNLAQQPEELFFKPLDTWASDSLDSLELYGVDATWNSHSRPAWTRFLISLLLRCPEDITQFRTWWHKDFNRTDPEAEARYNDERSTDDPDTFSDYLENQSLAVKEKHQFEIFYSLIDHAKIGAEINNMHWHVIDIPPEAHSLLTSDRPVIRTTNITPPDGHIALPIGPRKLFIASGDTKLIQKILRANRTSLAKECNRQVVESSMRFVYGVDEKQLRYVQNHFGKTPQPRLMDTIIARRKQSANRS